MQIIKAIAESSDIRKIILEVALIIGKLNALRMKDIINKNIVISQYPQVCVIIIISPYMIVNKVPPIVPIKKVIAATPPKIIEIINTLLHIMS